MSELPDRWADDLDYRSRIALIAGIIFGKVAAFQRDGRMPGPRSGILTKADIIEYRGHITTERMTGRLSEEQATKAIVAADQAEALIWLHQAATGTHS